MQLLLLLLLINIYIFFYSENPALFKIEMGEEHLLIIYLKTHNKYWL